MIAKPLTDLTRKDVPFLWSLECQHAFDELKRRLMSEPILGHPNPDRMFILTTDACKTGWGAVLSQGSGKEEYVISYASGKYSLCQQKYSTTELELLALKNGIDKFRHYLLGKPFVAVTDHQALSWLKRQKDPPDRLARWLLWLNQYDFEVRHKPGKMIPHADALSRVRTTKDMTECQSISDAVTNDLVFSWLRDELQGVKHKSDQPDSAELRYYLREKDKLSVVNGEIIRRSSGYASPQKLVPPVLRERVISLAHDHVLSGHFGVRKTIGRITPLYYWFGLTNSVRAFIRNCRGCALVKCEARPQREARGTIRVLGDKFEQISADILTLPLSSSGFKYVLVITDLFSKFVELYPMRNQSAESVAKCIVDFVCHYGIPVSLLTDQGSNFESDLIKQINDKLGIQKLRTSVYHACCNGQCERFNLTLCEALTQYVKSNCRDWDKYLQMIAFAYNTSVHSTTQVTPYKLVFGKEARHPIVSELDCEYLLEVPEYSEYANSLAFEFVRVYENVKSNIEKYQMLL